MIKKYLLFFLFIASIQIQFAQEIIFKGYVKNVSGKVLENVIVSKKYKNKLAEVTTISGGKFSIVLTDTTNLEAISFSYLGYETSIINAKDILLFIKKDKNADFILILKLKDVTLKQVVVTDKIPFYQNENASVFDYEIMPNGNLVLVMEKEIYLINQQDSILKAIQNKMGISFIIKACSGRIFLCSKKSLYTTYITDTTFLISDYVVDINSSLKQLSDLIACDSSIKIKESVSSHKQKIVYKIQPVSNLSIEINFYVAQNKEKMKRAAVEKSKIDRHDSLAELGLVPTMMTAETSFGGMVGGGSNGVIGKQFFRDEMLEVVWVEDQKEWKYEFYTSKKLYNPVFLHHDSIYVFDHVLHKITVIGYNKTGDDIHVNTLLKTPSTYHQNKGWQKIILQDNYTNNFFTVYRNERLVLSSIPIFDNKKQTTITLPKDHLYVEKLKVYKNTAYYLWRDITNPTSAWTLYKMPAG